MPGHTETKVGSGRTDDGTLTFSGVVGIWINVLAQQRGCLGATARTWPFKRWRDRKWSATWRSGTGLSYKFVYQQAHKARAVLDDAGSPAVPDSEALFDLTVTKAWLRQVIVGLTLICRSSYRGVVELLRDLQGSPVSVGCVQDVLQAAMRGASAVNYDQNLSGIRVGLHDELFQGATPVLAGVDAASRHRQLVGLRSR